MVNKDRVVLMTRLAIEEKHDTRITFNMDSFWFNDYASTILWKSFFAISFTFALLTVFGLVAFGDSWTVSYHLADCMALILKLLGIYACVLVLGLLISLFFHIMLYREEFRRRQRVKEYMKKLARLYQAEEKLRKAAK